jgi:hypothetical protein
MLNVSLRGDCRRPESVRQQRYERLCEQNAPTGAQPTGRPPDAADRILAGESKTGKLRRLRAPRLVSFSRLLYVVGRPLSTLASDVG